MAPVLPFGRSAHLEQGYGIGTGKGTALLWHDGDERDITHNAADKIVFEVADIIAALETGGEFHEYFGHDIPSFGNWDQRTPVSYSVIVGYG